MATSGALVSAKDALSETYDGLSDTKGAVVLIVVALLVTLGREVLHLSFTTVPFMPQITCRPLHPAFFLSSAGAVAFVALSGAVACVQRIGGLRKYHAPSAFSYVGCDAAMWVRDSTLCLVAWDDPQQAEQQPVAQQ